MQLNEIDIESLAGTWTHDTSKEISISSDPHELIRHYQPRLQVCLRPDLKEATYKELASMIDPGFLSRSLRFAELRQATFSGFDPEDTINFLVNSSKFEENGIQYMNQVQFVEWDEVGSDPDYKNAREKALMLLWVGNLKVHCTCPSHLYHGFQYLLTALDAAIYPETRPPVKRNPQQRGIVCKHMQFTFRVLPFHNQKIAAEIKRQFGS